MRTFSSNIKDGALLAVPGMAQCCSLELQASPLGPCNKADNNWIQTTEGQGGYIALHHLILTTLLFSYRKNLKLQEVN